jgi:hypothetical protein
MNKTDLRASIAEAVNDPFNWDCPGFKMLPAAHEELERQDAIIKAAAQEVHYCATVIRELASPVSIISADLYERLRKVHELLTGESE